MRKIYQGEGTELCGQAVVATISGVSLDRAIEVIGHRKGTNTKELIAAFSVLGVKAAPRLKRISKKMPILPKTCVLSMYSKSRDLGHWGAIIDGEFYEAGFVDRLGDFEITSYLEIYS